MKIVVCGADGQLGLCLRDAFAATSAEVFFYNRQALDITDFAAVEQTLATVKPEIVINAAAYTAVDKAESDIAQAYLVNETGPENLAKVTNTLGVALVHISTDYVFDGISSQPYKPNDKTSPISVYGKSKLAGELAIQAYNSKHIIIRTSWVFSEYGNNFVKTMLRLFREREVVSVVADQTGSPTYAGDLADGVISVCSTLAGSNFEAWGIFHFSSNSRTTWFDFASNIKNKLQETGQELKIIQIVPISTSDYPVAAARPKFSLLDCTDFSSKFGYAFRSYDVALERVLEKICLS